MKKNIFRMLSLTLVAVMFTCMTVYASSVPSFDLVGEITSSMSDMSTQVFGAIGIIVPVVLSIVGAKVAISVGINVFKSLTGRA